MPFYVREHTTINSKQVVVRWPTSGISFAELCMVWSPSRLDIDKEKVENHGINSWPVGKHIPVIQALLL